MAACVLLYEITHYLYDHAPTSALLAHSPRIDIANLSPYMFDRKQSLSSVSSLDVEPVMVAPPSPGMVSQERSPVIRRPISQLPQSSSLEADTAYRVHSFEEDLPEEGSPHKEVCVYLRVNSAVETRPRAGSRVNAALKQIVNVKYSDQQVTRRRSSLTVASLSVGKRHVSFHESSGDRSPTKARPAAATLGTLRPLPGKTGLPSSRSFQSEIPEPVPPEPVSLEPAFPSRPALQQQPSTASQRSLNIGSQIQHSISRLRTRARAFRHNIIRWKSTVDHRKPSVSGGSPSLLQRKKLPKLGRGVSITEESKRYFPWLEVVEHLVIVDGMNSEAHLKHAQVCKELVTALSHVYASPEGTGSEATTAMFHSISSAVFAGSSSHSTGSKSSELSSSVQLRKPPPTPVPFLKTLCTLSAGSSSRDQSQSLASLDFSQARVGVAGMLSSVQDNSIELFVEEDAELPPAEVCAGYNKARQSYIRESYGGLAHAPFSLLVYTAPILHPSTFTALKKIAWGMILDRNQELAKSAGKSSIIFFSIISIPVPLNLLNKPYVCLSPLQAASFFWLQPRKASPP